VRWLTDDDSPLPPDWLFPRQLQEGAVSGVPPQGRRGTPGIPGPCILISSDGCSAVTAGLAAEWRLIECSGRQIRLERLRKLLVSALFVDRRDTLISGAAGRFARKVSVRLWKRHRRAARRVEV